MQKKASAPVPPSSAHDSHDSHAYQHCSQEYVYNGVYYAQVENAGQTYRVGAITPHWRKELTNATVDGTHFQDLSEHGLWLAPNTAPQVDASQAVAITTPQVVLICAGIGGVYPGMGRALYDTFPAARQAMDRLAAVSHWDVLAMLDETNMEKLNCARWQLPYLFFVEYAQACHLQSLGFTPHIYAGHSFGELIALCLAGVYEPEKAWEIFDRRAALIDDFGHKQGADMGMMVVYAPLETVQRMVELFPGLHITNHNSPSQCIVGGKKELLTEARKALRKEKRPALIMPINMAFHHPHMRSLRDYSIQELHAYPFHTANKPILSNVTASMYPQGKEAIIEYIADLDENTVRWVDCVHTLWDTCDVRHFVELGAGDAVSNLVKEIMPEARCVAVTQKNDEVGAMRAATAQLYALGHIPWGKLAVVPASYATTDTQDSHAMPTAHTTADNAGAQTVLQEGGNGMEPTVQPVEQTPSPSVVQAALQASEQTALQASEQLQEQTLVHAIPIPHYVQDILPILAENTGIAVEKLLPHMDLRHDLSVRSSRFPAMLYAFEQQFGIQVQFEDVMHVATIQDLAKVVQHLRQQNIAGKEGQAMADTQTSPLILAQALAQFFPQHMQQVAKDFIQTRLINAAASLPASPLLVVEPHLQATQKTLCEQAQLPAQIREILWAKDIPQALAQTQGMPRPLLFLTEALFLEDSISTKKKDEERPKQHAPQGMSVAWDALAFGLEQWTQASGAQENTSTQGGDTFYPVQRHFSVYHPTFTKQDNAATHIDIQDLVHALYTTVAVLDGPWHLRGLDHVFLQETPFWPQGCVDGVSREAFGFVHVTSKAVVAQDPSCAEQATLQEQMPVATSLEKSTHMAQCALYLRDISANGRRQNTAQTVASAQVLLQKQEQNIHISQDISPVNQSLTPLWHTQKEKNFCNLGKGFAKQEGLWHSAQNNIVPALAWCMAQVQNIVQEQAVTQQESVKNALSLTCDDDCTKPVGPLQYIAHVRHNNALEKAIDGPLYCCWQPVAINAPVTSFEDGGQNHWGTKDWDAMNWDLIAHGHVYDAQGVLLLTLEKMCFAKNS